MIVTFYSFKGGVGRTLALANIGVILAQNGHRVLVVDFDLEAPGLTRYLENVFEGGLQLKCGLLELLERQREEGDAVDLIQKYTVEVLRTAKDGVLDLLTSGYQDNSYPKRILSFDWPAFFMEADGGNFFEYCRYRWAQSYDFVLIDSRTGITDSGGICTIQLPDVIVPVFTASRQSVEGVIDVVRRAQEGRQLLAYDRAPAAIVPLPSRFDSRTEYALSQQWLEEFTARFREFYAPWLPKEASVRQVLERTKLPYVAFFSFGERLPVFDESGSDPESLSYALRTIAGLLESDLRDVSRILTSSANTTADDGNTSGHLESTARGISFTRDPIATKEPDLLATGQASQGHQEVPAPRAHRLLAPLVAIIALLSLVLAVGVVALIQNSETAPSPAPGPPTTGPRTVLAGHTSVVTSVTFGPDGRTVASGSADNTVRLWNAADSAPPTPIGDPLTGHTASVTSVAFSPDGSTLASGSADKTVLLWDVTNPTRPRQLGEALTGHTASVTSVAFSPDGRTLASGSADYTVRLWSLTDIASPQAEGGVLQGHSDSVESVDFSPDGRTLASGSADKTVLLWDLTDWLASTADANKVPTKSVPGAGGFSGRSILFARNEVGKPPESKPPTTLVGSRASVTSVAFSPDGRTLASGSADVTVLLWDVTNPSDPRLLGESLTGHTASVTSVAFSPDGRTLATSSADQTVLLWDLTDRSHPTRRGEPLTGPTASIMSVAFSPNGRTVAGGSADQTVVLWRPS